MYTYVIISKMVIFFDAVRQFGGITSENIKYLEEKIMKKVNYELWEDMKKYIPELDENDYFITTTAKTQISVIKKVREYYNTHLPVDVLAWKRVNEPILLTDSILFESQIKFVCETFKELLFDDKEIQPMVVATHISDGILLPVYQIKLEKYGITLTMSSNFKNWIVSVNSEQDLDWNYMELFNPDEKIELKEYLGIPKDSIYGNYSASKKTFSVSIKSIYRMYMFIFLMIHHLREDI